jgi:hypothetical protein
MLSQIIRSLIGVDLVVIDAVKKDLVKAKKIKNNLRPKGVKVEYNSTGDRQARSNGASMNSGPILYQPVVGF